MEEKRYMHLRLQGRERVGIVLSHLAITTYAFSLTRAFDVALSCALLSPRTSACFEWLHYNNRQAAITTAIPLKHLFTNLIIRVRLDFSSHGY